MSEPERVVERYFAARVLAIRGMTYKWSSPSHRGVPDRIAIFPGGVVWFIEIKQESGRMSKLQEHTCNKINDLGANVTCLHGKAEVDEFIDKIQAA